MKLDLETRDIASIVGALVDKLRPVIKSIVKDTVEEAITSSGGVRPEVRYLNKRQVAAKFGISARGVDRLEERGEIPRRRQLGGRRVGWLEHECDEALLNRPLGIGGAPVPNDPTSE